MRILKLERFENFRDESRAEICLTAKEIHKLYSVLHKEEKNDNCNGGVYTLAKDLFLLDTLLSHGNIDKSDASVISMKLIQEEKANRSNDCVEAIEVTTNG